VQPCATTSGSVQCFVCDLSGGGVCAHVCSLLQQDCPTGQTCHEFTVADGGIVSDISVTGNGCDGFGFCR
jgi:hypothetical protein